MTTLATAAIWPTVTDWDGTAGSGTGTLWNAAFDSDVQDAIDDQTHSTSNPTIKPKATTDEMVIARGDQANLNARLDAHCNSSGVLTTPSTIASAANLQAQLGQVNLLVNDAMLIWPAGDTTVPAGWGSSGSPTIARSGSGLGDPIQGFGLYAMKITRNAASSYVYQYILDAGIYGDLNDVLDGLVVGFGAFVYSATASLVRVACNDGDTVSHSTYHTGDSTWQWLGRTKTIGASSDRLEYRVTLEDVAGSAYVTAPVFMFTELAPTGWVPTPKRYGHVKWSWDGAPAVADGARRAAFGRPALVKDFQAYAKTAPGGGNNLTIDVETETDGAGTWSSMFSGAQNIIVTTANVGGVQPDGTYANRCLAAVLGTTIQDGLVRCNIDAAGSAADVDIWMRVLQYAKPLEEFMAHDDVGL